jgi:hypothetical protein
MGIDVAWNCAISLRPLESGENDPHRMVSNYGDWDKNARLPHGVRDVRIHIEEVDNVPLLVSLFTDATKTTTKEMVRLVPLLLAGFGKSVQRRLQFLGRTLRLRFSNSTRTRLSQSAFPT